MKARVADQAVLFAALFGAWQLLSLLLGAHILTPPWDTIVRAGELLRSAVFWKHAASTGEALILAIVLAIAAGVLIGFWLGLRRFAGDVADPILGSLYSIPKITLYPIILLLFGLTLSAKVAFAFIHGVFPIAIFTMNALRNVAPVHRRTARVFRLSPVETVTAVLAPAALPEILTGVRIGFAVTLLGTLIAELFASSEGIGFALIGAAEIHDVDDILALTLLLFVFAAIVNALLHAIERKVHRHG